MLVGHVCGEHRVVRYTHEGLPTHLADNITGGLIDGQLRSLPCLRLFRLVPRACRSRLLCVTATHDSAALCNLDRGRGKSIDARAFSASRGQQVCHAVVGKY